MTREIVPIDYHFYANPFLIDSYHDVPSVDPARVSFLTRLKTYTVSVWADKPFDPPMCARLGWEVVESDMLKCVMCSQYLSVSLPSPAKQQSCTNIFFFLCYWFMIQIYLFWFQSRRLAVS